MNWELSSIFLNPVAFHLGGNIFNRFLSARFYREIAGINRE